MAIGSVNFADYANSEPRVFAREYLSLSTDWINRRAAQVIIDHLAARRPAWLWSKDGETLIWRNSAARLFLARQRKRGVRPAKNAIPIKGQVRRLLRLGSVGLASLARVRFLSGQKPVSATCNCTPLVLENQRIALLIVGVDKIDKPLFKGLDQPDPRPSSLLGEGHPHVFVDENGQIVGGSEDLPAGLKDVSFSRLKGWNIALKASGGRAGLGVPDASTLPGAVVIPDTADDKTADAADVNTPVLDTTPLAGGQLSVLVDQLAGDSGLFEPLGPEDDEIPHPVPEPETPRLDDETGGDHSAGEVVATPVPATSQWRITGRGFGGATTLGSPEQQAAGEKDQLAGVRASLGENEALDAGATPGTEPARQEERNTGTGEAGEPETPSVGQREEVDRVARYNFDELARILGERVASEPGPQQRGKKPTAGQNQDRDHDQRTGRDGKTIKLSDELVVLNRLSLGILIFRDQNILFANRALADIMGGTTISKLREGGLDAIFPRIDNDAASLGPVATLLDVNGNEVPVTARLQSILWQGKSALMLSAQPGAPPGDAESGVQAFVRARAAAQGEGYFEADETGIVRSVSEVAAGLLATGKDAMTGLPLLQLVAKNQQSALREFLQRPAKFAETPRPSLKLQTADGALELNLFTGGRAGVVSGYFGTLKAADTRPGNSIGVGSGRADGLPRQADTQLLSRLSRGIRRPLNTIIGFSELIESEAFGRLDNPRYAEYSRDIKSAGLEIARLAGEIDEYVGLEDADQVAQPADFNLGNLLDECLRLVRRQASRRQVFVRSAISDTLGGIVADRATLRQAILNLLASAIDRTKGGGKVVLSAQSGPDGSIDVHVRNSGVEGDDTSELFVVFRESEGNRDEALVPMKSSIGLALTRSLLAVNACTLVVDLSAGAGTLMTLAIPAGRTVKRA